MPKFSWREGAVLSLRLRDGSFCLLQLLKSPYVAFFKAFSPVDEWPGDAAARAEVLLVCATAKVFTKFSPLKVHKELAPHHFELLPTLWIRPFPGVRKVTVYPGTPAEREVTLISRKPGGQLIEKHVDAVGVEPERLVREDIPLNDQETIDGHEMVGIWPYPGLNERLLVCKTLGRCVDPEKDLVFDRPMIPEYATYMDIRTKRGTPEDWGYSSTPPQ